VPVIPYVRATHTVSSPWTAAKANVVEEGVNDAHYMPSVKVYHNATQSLTSGTETALAFNTELWDTAGNAASTQHDNVTNNSRLTCRYGGIYQVTASAEFAASATGSRALYFRVDGTASQYLGAVNTSSVLSAVTVTLNLTSLLSLAVNNYVQVIAFQNSGGALNVNAGTALAPYVCSFMMVRVG
jgi:hypothetical protein